MKRIIYVLLSFLIVFLSSPASMVFAQAAPAAPEATSWKFVPPITFGKAIQGTAMNSQSAWFSGFQYSMYAISCIGLGLNCTDKAEDQYKYLCSSAAASINNVMASTFTTKPADVGYWAMDTGKTLGFIPNTVYAQGQGIGFAGMEPLLPIWKAFRNIAYLLTAIIMVAIGFMIMFRKKIDPKTVVTAQNAIPKIILTLILITFSYAIVGAMIDVMYILIYFFIALFKSTGLLSSPPYPICKIHTTPEQLYANGGLISNYAAITKDPYKLLFGWDVGAPKLLSTGLTFAGIIALLTGFCTGLLGFVAGGGLGILGLAMPIIHAILTVAIIYLFIRLLFFFLTAYIQIIVSLLLAPIQLLFEAIPGSNAFSSWFKNLVSNLAVFPVGVAMFMLSNVFATFSDDAGAKIWAPPLATIGGAAMGSSQIAYLVSIGILFAIPQVAGSIKEALKAKPIAPMFDGGGAGNTAMQWLSMAYYIKALNPGQLMERATGKKPGESGGGH